MNAAVEIQDPGFPKLSGENIFTAFVPKKEFSFFLSGVFIMWESKLQGESPIRRPKQTR